MGEYTISNAGRPVFAATPVANRLCVKAKRTNGNSAGICTSWSVFNHGSAQFIQVHIGSDIDPTTGPDEARVPQFVIKVSANAGAAYDTPIRFDDSMWLCNSSTRDTLTAGSADCSWLAHLA